MTGAMSTLSDVLPLSHVVGGLRLAWLGQTDDPHLLWWPLTVAAIAVAVAVASARRRAG
jgi:ABC-type polysaccharide/polyol phosphate export permease